MIRQGSIDVGKIPINSADKDNALAFNMDHIPEGDRRKIKKWVKNNNKICRKVWDEERKKPRKDGSTNETQNKEITGQ
jgi:hypothetical protein